MLKLLKFNKKNRKANEDISQRSDEDISNQPEIEHLTEKAIAEVRQHLAQSSQREHRYINKSLAEASLEADLKFAIATREKMVERFAKTIEAGKEIKNYLEQLEKIGKLSVEVDFNEKEFFAAKEAYHFHNKIYVNLRLKGNPIKDFETKAVRKSKKRELQRNEKVKRRSDRKEVRDEFRNNWATWRKERDERRKRSLIYRLFAHFVDQIINKKPKGGG